MTLLTKFFYVLGITAGIAVAQTEDLDMHNKGFTNLTQAGKLFTVTADPKDTIFEIFVSGKDAAKIDFDKTQVQAEYGFGSEKKTVILSKGTDEETGKTVYLLKKRKGGYNNLNLNIRSGGQSESVTFQKLR